MCGFERNNFQGKKEREAESGDEASAINTEVARFFFVQLTKTGKNVPNDHRFYHRAIKYIKEL
jgi:hypothetical protein